MYLQYNIAFTKPINSYLKLKKIPSNSRNGNSVLSEIFILLNVAFVKKALKVLNCVPV